ncbi:MAG: anti-sigma regulatory factor [bacterium]
MHMDFPVKGGNFSEAGEAASKIKSVLKQIGVQYEIIRRVAIASYEAEMNIVAHAEGGQISVDIAPEEISVTASDKGPGIPDIEQAMIEGFSTASAKIREMGFGAGMGLPNIKRAVDWMNIESTAGESTTLQFKISLKKPVSQ